MIKLSELTAFFGASSIDKDFVSFLEKQYIFNLPKYINEKSEYGEYFDYESSLSTLHVESERNRLTLLFSERESYELIYPKEHPTNGNFVFREVVIYGKDNYHIGYSGDILFGLSLDMTQEQVHYLLGNPIASREINGELVGKYAKDKMILNILYSEGKAYSIHIRPYHLYDYPYVFPNFPERNDSYNIDTNHYLLFLGQSLFSRELVKILPEYSDDNLIVEKNCDFCIYLDFVEGMGLSIFYNNSYHFSNKIKTKDDGLIFSGFRLTRRGRFGSKGFQGKIPFGLTFSMGLEGVNSILGTPFNEFYADDSCRLSYLYNDVFVDIYFDLIDYQAVTFSFYGLFMKQHLA